VGGGVGETTTTAVRNAVRIAAARSPAWMRGIERGGSGGESMTLGRGRGDMAKKGNGGGRCILWRPGGAGGEEKGRGVRKWGRHVASFSHGA
jgi:hypothetical protein